jgi:hypothetical protein
MPHEPGNLLPMTQTERDEMSRLLPRLRQDDFLREVASPLFGDSPTHHYDALRIEERLWEEETCWRERALAAWTLGFLELAPNEKRTAANALSRLVTNQMKAAGSGIGSRSVRAWGRAATFTVYGLSALMLVGNTWKILTTTTNLKDLLMYLFAIPIVGLMVGFMLSFFAFPIFWPFSVALDVKRSNFVRATAVTALGRLRVPESVGVLADALYSDYARIRQAAEPALMAVLPTLTPEHYGQLPANTVFSLHVLLGHVGNLYPRDKRREILMALLLEALAKVGDGRSVELVQYLANEISEFPRVRAAAAAALPILLQRREQEKARDMLLRASSAPQSQPAELLRPVSAQPETQIEQLLRPSQTE